VNPAGGFYTGRRFVFGSRAHAFGFVYARSNSSTFFCFFIYSFRPPFVARKRLAVYFIFG
jgi:hypothetical protein